MVAAVRQFETELMHVFLKTVTFVATCMLAKAAAGVKIHGQVCAGCVSSDAESGEDEGPTRRNTAIIDRGAELRGAPRIFRPAHAARVVYEIYAHSVLVRGTFAVGRYSSSRRRTTARSFDSRIRPSLLTMERYGG